ncbi:Adaptin N terminal region family protein [Leishmania donovani]|uniref:Adaptin N terminal region family protein n=2 Tax=Leishmania donovani TaxID=5661 RepID=A0A504XMI6_LEIDO|nr:Adaptin N terminal region family protein [Leishmania donovani]
MQTGDNNSKQMALRKVTALMAGSMDTAVLFAEAIISCCRNDLEDKTMVHLCLTTTLKQKESLAVLAINVLVKECSGQSPMMRGSAPRALWAMREHKCFEYALRFPSDPGVQVSCKALELLLAVHQSGATQEPREKGMFEMMNLLGEHLEPHKAGYTIGASCPLELAASGSPSPTLLNDFTNADVRSKAPLRYRLLSTAMAAAARVRFAAKQSVRTTPVKGADTGVMDPLTVELYTLSIVKDAPRELLLDAERRQWQYRTSSAEAAKEEDEEEDSVPADEADIISEAAERRVDDDKSHSQLYTVELEGAGLVSGSTAIEAALKTRSIVPLASGM